MKLAKLTLLSVLLSFNSLAYGFGELLHTFDDPTVTSFDVFGTSVALDGNHVLIGASRDETNGTLVGQAHLFDVTTGSLLQTFNDPTVTSLDQFGFSVALEGNHVLIGALGDDTNGANVGQAHLFDVTTGSLLQTFNDPTVTNQDHFGFSVALEGNHVLIGAPFDNTNGQNVGQAHLFDASTGSLLQTFNDPTVTNQDHFGHSVAIDGNHVLIGAAADDTNGFFAGQAHLFDASTGSLLRTFNDPTVMIADDFGTSVALDGNHVLIGAPGDDTSGFGVGQAHLFDASTGILLRTFNDPTVTNNDSFGNSVALEGNHVLIGASRDDTNGGNVGQAHLFDASTGSLLETFNDPTVTGADQFGSSVALDGNHVLIGALGDDTSGDGVGQAHLFNIEEEIINFELGIDENGPISLINMSQEGLEIVSLTIDFNVGGNETFFDTDSASPGNSSEGFSVTSNLGNAIVTLPDDIATDGTQEATIGFVGLDPAEMIGISFDIDIFSNEDVNGDPAGGLVTALFSNGESVAKTIIQSDFLNYSLSTATIAYGLFGDFNGDGNVDAADYTIWRDSLGSTGIGLAADANQDGIVNGVDYGFWASNYGATSPALASSNSVPEPSALLLIASSGIIVMTSRRRIVG